MAGSRTIVVDDQEYRWKSNQAVVRAWIDRHGPAALRVSFRDPDPDPDFGQRRESFADGWIASGIRTYNTHRPAMVADLIRLALARDWDPLGRRPLDLDGFGLLRTSPAELTHERFNEPSLERAAQLLERCAAAADQSPLGFWRDRTERPWLGMYPSGGPYVLMTVVSMLEFGLLLDQPSALSSIERNDLQVWSDARQATGLPGGLVLAHWLASRSIESVLVDLHAWSDLLGRTER